jgi:hypothetical protein
MIRAGWPGRVFEGVVEELLRVLGDGERESELDVSVPTLDTSLAF